jgi:hypothetical protein
MSRWRRLADYALRANPPYVFYWYASGAMKAISQSAIDEPSVAPHAF